MTEKLECFECEQLVEPRIEERKETLPVRGEPVEVLARVGVCPECGADMSVPELDEATLVAAFNQYRSRHGLMTPEEMRRLRERYGLGQRAFALLLGWGEITLHRYESGSLQDDAHNAQLKMAEDPANIRILLETNGHKLTARQRARLETRLREVEGDSAVERTNPFVAREDRGIYGDAVRPRAETAAGFDEVLADFRDKFSQRGEFVLGSEESVRTAVRENGVPVGYGVYVISAIRGTSREVVYIGKAGTLRHDGYGEQGLRKRLKMKQGDVPRERFFPDYIAEQKLDGLHFEWFVTVGEATDTPPFLAEALLLAAHVREYGRLPALNLEA